MEKPSILFYSTAIAIALLLCPAVSAGDENPDDILIVSNLSMPDKGITIEEARQMFLDKRRNLPSGSKAIPFNAPIGSTLRNEFRKRVLKMSSEDERTYWQNHKIKTGKTSPAEFRTTLKAVFKIKKGVSYVFRSDYKKGVSKILLSVQSG